VIRITAAALLLALAFVQQPASAPYRDPNLPVDARVKDLLARMTLEEKFWQLYMSPGSLDDAAHDYSKGSFGLQISVAREPSQEAGSSDPAGRAAAVARAHAERINAIQRYFVEKTRLGIPILPFEEAVHGLSRDGATMFPAAIALAAAVMVTPTHSVGSALQAVTTSISSLADSTRGLLVR